MLHRVKGKPCLDVEGPILHQTARRLARQKKRAGRGEVPSLRVTAGVCRQGGREIGAVRNKSRTQNHQWCQGSGRSSGWGERRRLVWTQGTGILLKDLTSCFGTPAPYGCDGLLHGDLAQGVRESEL